ncbi:MAG: DUF1565 domain-containing protein [Planctomycetota bacterium]|nr:DUF1565 domain-containing protein [Planctomycetota bacterium]
MRLSSLSLLLTFLLTALVACGGGGGGGDETDDTAALPGIYVHATNGSDLTGDGSPENPFRTITKGLGAAVNGDVVRVGPGLYDAALGEVFPLEPGLGVAVRGTVDVTVLGGPKPLTRVVGGGLWDGDAEGRLHATFVPGPLSLLRGLAIHNPQAFVPFPGPKPAAVVLAHAEVTLDGCRLHDSDKGIRIVAGALGNVIERCAFDGNGIGLFISETGPGHRVEGCTLTENGAGVMAFAAGVDFGGGDAGSEGGNAFARNDGTDFVYFVGTPSTAFAQNCFWDVQSPTVATGNPPSAQDTDIWQVTGVVDATGAKKYRAPGGVVVPDVVVGR